MEHIRAGSPSLPEPRPNPTGPRPVELELPSPRPSIVATTVWAIIHAVLWLPLLAGLIAWVPRLMRTWADFGMKLPAVTELLIDASVLARDVAVVIPPLIVLGIACDAVVIYFLRINPKMRPFAWFWLVLLILLPLAVTAVAFAAAWLPMIELHEGLSK